MNIDEKIKNTQKEYLQEFNFLTTCNDLDLKVKKACLLTKKLTHTAAGIYFSKAIEDVFLELANTSVIDCANTPFKKNTFLHVLTMAYTTGGHTRVVEKWIQQANQAESHSVVILQQGKHALPPLLEIYTREKNGSVTLFDNEELLDRALQLRAVASKYEYIILHVHMDDPTAIVAFGNEEFTRPVLFYNHASHMFWIGKSIYDKLLDIKDNDFITVNKRQINDAYRIGIPLDFKQENNLEKKIAREKLNLPIDKNIIVTAGTAHKFMPFCGKFWGDALFQIVSEIENTQIIVIGVDSDNERWKNICIKSNNHIVTMSKVDYHKEYFLYLNSADIVLDSWPIPGWTVVLDALMCDTPVLCIKSPFESADYIENTSAFCESTSDLMSKVTKILTDETFKIKILNEAKTLMLQDVGSDAWQSKINLLLSKIPPQHSITRITNEQENIEINDKDRLLYSVHNSLNISNKTILKIFRVESKQELKYKSTTLYLGKIKLLSYKIDIISGKITNIFIRLIFTLRKLIKNQLYKLLRK